MRFDQDPTNVMAHGGSSGEMSRWRDQGTDPELLVSPASVVVANRARAEARSNSFIHPLAALVADHAEVVVQDAK